MREFVEDQAARFGSRRQLAKAAGISTRALRAGEARSTFNVSTCLRLAAATGAAVVSVLQLARKTEEAEILEGLCAGATERTLSQRQVEVLTVWEGVPVAMQSALLGLMRSLS